MTADNKIYDGTTNATLSGTITNTPTAFVGDNVMVVGPYIAGFSSKNVGNWPVTVTGYTLSGTDANNYSLTQPTVPNASISKDDTTCVVTSSLNPSGLTSNVTFTATVQGVVVAADSPTGNVVLLIDDGIVGSPILTAAGANTATATYSTTSLSLGDHTVKAQYTADGNFNGSPMSAILTQTVANAVSPVTITNVTATTIKYTGGGGAEFVLMQSSSLTVPRSGWTDVATNSTTPGTFTISTGSGDKKFYSIRSQ